jgi:CHAT domain-containing protein
VDLSCKRWEQLLAFGSEEQLEKAWITVHEAGVGESLGDASLAATVALRFKDSIAGSLLENRRRVQAAGKGSATTKLAIAAETARARLRDVVQQGAPLTIREKAGREVEDAEKALARKLSRQGTTRSALHITAKEVAATLPPGAVLVEFSLHTVFGEKPAPDKKGQIAYTAILIAAGREPRLVSLGSRDDMDLKIECALLALKAPPAGAASNAVLDAFAEEVFKELHAAVMAPIEAALPPDTKTLVISPDADIHFVPFAALVDAGGRLAGDKYTIRYVTSGRDLLSPPPAPSKVKTVTLLGNPDYAKSAGKTVPSSDPALAEVGRDVSFEPLPGTAAEVDAMQKLFQEQRWKIRILTGGTATENALMNTEAPAVLHLATHGFFLNRVDNKHVMSELQSSHFARSLANSGLALASAGSTAREWARGRLPSPSTDGILTAAETASLPLEGTELITLSACETGLGLSMPGNGVAGLKRALTLAGARNVLTTLWPVADEETAALMKAFYTAYLSGEDPGLALAHTQRDLLARWRQEHGLWFALNRAGPFVLTGTTKLAE